MKKKFDTDFYAYGGYGWASGSPAVLRDRIKAALPSFERLRRKVKFDVIAFTGSSGACIAFTLAYETEIPLLYVRKPGEKSHGSRIESNAGKTVKKYLIVDDFIDSGDTIRNIVKRIDRACSMREVNAPKPVGVFLFDTSVSIPRKVSLNEDTWLKCWSPENC